MKILQCQFEPEFKNLVANKIKASRLIDGIVDNVDLIILPEMAFTGYCFQSRQDILPFCELQDGPTFQWASALAKQRNCCIQVGYPRIDDSKRLYNSLMLISPSGELISTYDKHFLYSVDESWAEEGSAFMTAKIDFNQSKLKDGCDYTNNSDGCVNVGFGICMDLSPYQFKAPFELFEFGTFQANNDADIILCCMAWLLPGSVDDDIDNQDSSSNRDKDDAANSRDQDNIGDNNAAKNTPNNTGDKDNSKNQGNTGDTEMQMMNYWALRLSPLIKASVKKPVTVVICNRVGKEGSTVFGGTSCCLRFVDGKAMLVGNLSCKEEGCLLVEVDL
jgi:protein N-terminal amidase